MAWCITRWRHNYWELLLTLSIIKSWGKHLLTPEMWPAEIKGSERNADTEELAPRGDQNSAVIFHLDWGRGGGQNKKDTMNNRLLAICHEILFSTFTLRAASQSSAAHQLWTGVVLQCVQSDQKSVLKAARMQTQKTLHLRVCCWHYSPTMQCTMGNGGAAHSC